MNLTHHKSFVYFTRMLKENAPWNIRSEYWKHLVWYAKFMESLENIRTATYSMHENSTVGSKCFSIGPVWCGNIKTENCEVVTMWPKGKLTLVKRKSFFFLPQTVTASVWLYYGYKVLLQNLLGGLRPAEFCLVVAQVTENTCMFEFFYSRWTFLKLCFQKSKTH